MRPILPNPATAAAAAPWRTTLLTNFGVYAVGHREREPSSYGTNGLPDAWRTRTEVSFRVLADWGVLVPLDARRGVGASVVVSLDDDYSFVGLYGRYRHRIDAARSVDVAVGIPITRGDGTRPLGLLKYNMTRHVGVALRPELRSELKRVNREARARVGDLPDVQPS